MPDNNTLFASVDLEIGDQQKLRTLRDKELALQNLVRMQQEMAERRAQEVVEIGRTVWDELSKKYKLDVKHINYVPNDEFTQLRPTMVKLV